MSRTSSLGASGPLKSEQSLLDDAYDETQEPHEEDYCSKCSYPETECRCEE